MRYLTSGGVVLEGLPTERPGQIQSFTRHRSVFVDRHPCRDRRPREAFPAHRLDRVPPDLGDAACDGHCVGESTPADAPSLGVESRHSRFVARRTGAGHVRVPLVGADTRGPASPARAGTDGRAYDVLATDEGKGPRGAGTAGHTSRRCRKSRIAIVRVSVRALDRPHDLFGEPAAPCFGGGMGLEL